MNKKDVLIASICLAIIGGCTIKTVQLIKKRKQQEVIADEEMVYENEQ